MIAVAVIGLASLVVSSHSAPPAGRASMAAAHRYPRFTSGMLRRRAWRSRGTLGVVLSVPAILASLGHSDEHVRRHAIGLRRCGAEPDDGRPCASPTARVSELDSEDEEVRCSLKAHASPPPQCSAAARLVVLDDDGGVRWAAVDAMASLDGGARPRGAVDVRAAGPPSRSRRRRVGGQARGRQPGVDGIQPQPTRWSGEQAAAR